ncbi:hypothetical protein JCM18899A_47950 [Nocardioides sp. AN3]
MACQLPRIRCETLHGTQGDGEGARVRGTSPDRSFAGSLRTADDALRCVDQVQDSVADHEQRVTGLEDGAVRVPDGVGKRAEGQVGALLRRVSTVASQEDREAITGVGEVEVPGAQVEPRSEAGREPGDVVEVGLQVAGHPAGGCRRLVEGESGAEHGRSCCSTRAARLMAPERSSSRSSRAPRSPSAWLQDHWWR